MPEELQGLEFSAGDEVQEQVEAIALPDLATEPVDSDDDGSLEYLFAKADAIGARYE